VFRFDVFWIAVVKRRGFSIHSWSRGVKRVSISGCSVFQGWDVAGIPAGVPIVNSHSGVLAPSKFQDLSEMRRFSKSYCISEISNAMSDFLFEYNHTLGFRFNHGRGFPLSIEIDAPERAVRLAFSHGG
jgi:hypothetical protein